MPFSFFKKKKQPKPLVELDITMFTEDENGNIFRLNKPHTDSWRGKVFTVPEGFRSDGVSTPRFLWATVSPKIHPATLRGGVNHDYIYRVQPSDWTRAEADRMFYDIIREDGTAWHRAVKAYLGVRLFGRIAWRQNARKRGAA